MAGLLNRLKNRKTGPNSANNGEGDSTSISSFDEEGFLCPVCHRKFADHTTLEQHYTQTHIQQQPIEENHDINPSKQPSTQETVEDPIRELFIWKQQFAASEESRMLLSTELMQYRQRVGDLEEELEHANKQLRTTQTKVIEQSQEIGNLKATKDVYDAQLAIFTNELLSTQDELKEKQIQVASLCDDLIPRPSSDDVDVLKRELISVQHRTDEMSLEKEQQITRLRDVLLHSYQQTHRLDDLQTTFDQNVSINDEILIEFIPQINNEINQLKQFVQLARQQRTTIETTMKSMRKSLTENRVQIDELQQNNTALHVDLEQRIQSIEHLTNDLNLEQKQTQSLRTRIETINGEMSELEKTLDELRQEKNDLFLAKMDGDQDDERQNLVRQLTREKDQFEQQIKELRTQIKQINEERQQIQSELEIVRQQFTDEKNQLEQQTKELRTQITQINEERQQIQSELEIVRQQFTDEKNQFELNVKQINSELQSVRQQLNETNTDKEQRINELTSQLSSTREQFENDVRIADENQKRDIERLEGEIKSTISRGEERTNEIKIQCTEQIDIIRKEKEEIEQQVKEKQESIDGLNSTITQLRTDLQSKGVDINRLIVGMRRGVQLAQQAQQRLQENVDASQIDLLATIEQSQNEYQSVRGQFLEEIHSEFTNYLTVVYGILTDSKSKFEQNNAKLIHEQEQNEEKLKKIKEKHQHSIDELQEQKQQLQVQLGELNNKLLQVSESLSETSQTADFERQKFEKQMASLEHDLLDTRNDLETRTKKHERQLSALTENLASVRSELKGANEKLANVEQIKSEKADLESRLAVSQDERHVLLERSLTSESKNDKLLFENGQLIKRNTDLESALQEIAREYQGLQIQTNKASERRWLNDADVISCMKCNLNFTVTQRKHHCRCCGNIFCDVCSAKTAIINASSKKPQRVCDQCYKDLTS